MMFSFGAWAQDRTTVTATTTDISDNLDLRAVASLFGDAENLEEFERMLNDPKKKISNLDLNRDNQVDYLRVVESVEGRTHLVLIQAVLERDVFQDVATVEVERDRNDRVQIQVVGDSYMYGPNYIYEPVYGYTPVIYNTFWVSHYRPYWSSWYWGYYPSWYYAWHPVPVYSYCNNVALYVNNHHHYHYASGRRSSRAAQMHNGIRANGYRTHYEGRSFAQRANVKNRAELDQIRTVQGTRTASVPRTNTSTPGTRTTQQQASLSDNASNMDATPVTGIRSVRTQAPREQASGTRTSMPVADQPVRTRSITVETPVRSSVRTSAPSVSQPRSTAPVRTNIESRRTYSQQPQTRQSTPSYQSGVQQSAPARIQRPASSNFGATRAAAPIRSSAVDRPSLSPSVQSGPTRSSRR